MFKVSLTFHRPPELGKNKWKAFCKAGHLAMGLEWQRTMLPDHFNRNARSKYKHQPRTAKYLRNKERGGYRKVNGRRVQIKYGGQVDNVFSGDMEAMLKGSSVVRAFPTRTTITMTGPQYVTMRPYKSNQPAKGREIATTTDEQATVLERILERETVEAYSKWRQPKTIKIG
ncbi:MAG: hypothetical protein IAF94_21010 [Pirellulaceae bacterium]|nr:hypothetical protein [Pirellulaceae bacterium]